MKIKDTTKHSKTSGEDACLRAAPRHTAPPAPHARGQNPSRSACSLPALSLPQLYPPLQLPPPATSRCLPGMGPAVFLRHLQMCMKDPGPGEKTANRVRERAALPAQPWPSCGVCRALRVGFAGARLASCLEADAVASLIFRRGSGGTERLGHPSEVTQQSLEQGVAPGSLALSCGRVCVCGGAHACAGVRSDAFLITANTIGALTGLTGGGILIPSRAPCERSRSPTPRLPLRRHF